MRAHFHVLFVFKFFLQPNFSHFKSDENYMLLIRKKIAWSNIFNYSVKSIFNVLPAKSLPFIFKVHPFENNEFKKYLLKLPLILIQ